MSPQIDIHGAQAVLAPPGTADLVAASPSAMNDLVQQLREMSLRGLSRMYSQRDRLFVFRLRRTPGGIVQEGLSPRYTAITLIGLAALPEKTVGTVLGGDSRHDVCARILEDAASSNSLGDVALSLFAAGLVGHENLDPAVTRLAALQPLEGAHPVVEIAWLLTALSEVPSANREHLRDHVAERLMSTFHPGSKLFPHTMGRAGGARSHVSCFADLIYPIQALAKYAAATGSQRALDIASACATRLCDLQGAGGQWWWHYDYRSGRVIEEYPVYAIHQDAMGPMGLRALVEAGGPDFSHHIHRGLMWLGAAPELNGGSLIDKQADLVWRKVCRREPRKAVRYLQATASRIHPAGRIPAVDFIFPARRIDFEDRPYHLGWLLYAWSGWTGRLSSMSPERSQ
jgi:hypothetical protein